MSVADASVYGAESDRHREKLEQLVNRIENRIGHRIPSYTVKWDENSHSVTGLDAFCDMVSSDLKALFADEWKKTAEISGPERCIAESALFFEKKAADCVASDRLIEEYENCIDRGDISFFFLSGPSGCGKSTLMGRMACDYIKNGGDVFTFACGYSLQAGTSSDLLVQLDAYLTGLLGADADEEDENRTFSALRRRFMHLAGIYAEKRKDRTLYIFIDAMEMMTGDGILRLGWAPDIMPDNMKIICSFTDDKVFEPPLRSAGRLARRTRESLSPEEIRLIAASAFARAHKQISGELLEKIAGLKPAENPLYLTLLIHRLMILNSADFGVIAETGNDMRAINGYLMKIIDEMPETTEELCRYVLSGAGACIDGELADRVTKILAKNVRGLREKDVFAVCERTGKPADALSYARLMKYLRPFFITGADGRTAYSHRILRDAVFSDMDRDTRVKLNAGILGYLKTLPSSDPVCADCRTEFAWLCWDRQDLVSYISGLDGKKDSRAYTAAMSFVSALTRSGNETVHRQITDFFDGLESVDGYMDFVRKLARGIYLFYPLTAGQQKALQRVYRSLAGYMEKACGRGELPPGELISAYVKLIRSYNETGQSGKTEELLNRAADVINRTGAEDDPAYYRDMALIHRYHAEYCRDTLKFREMLHHCAEAERIAMHDKTDNTFGIINAKMLYCEALISSGRYREACVKADENRELCGKYYAEKETVFRKKMLAASLAFLGQAYVLESWFVKMNAEIISVAREKYSGALALYEEVSAEEKAYNTYLDVAGTYAGAAKAEIFYWSVCPDDETDAALELAGAYLDKAGSILKAVENAVGTLRARQYKSAYLGVLYAWYEVKNDRKSSSAVYEKMTALSHEIESVTGKRSNPLALALSLHVPKRRKKGLFGRK